MISAFEKLIPKLKKAVMNCYGERLVSLVLYGSVGRKTPNYDSDIDMLIITEHPPKGRMRRVREFENVEKELRDELLKLHNRRIYLSLSPIIKSREEVLLGSPLFLDMIDDSIILYDRKNFFKDYLQAFKKRLENLGAKRINLGGYWYWILKSDYKPGEVFEI
ncbi:MAG: nucleotidyltransferase domain-containing protein [bacterium]